MADPFDWHGAIDEINAEHEVEVARLEGEKAALEAALKIIEERTAILPGWAATNSPADVFLGELWAVAQKARAALSGEGQGWLSPDKVEMVKWHAVEAGKWSHAGHAHSLSDCGRRACRHIGLVLAALEVK